MEWRQAAEFRGAAHALGPDADPRKRGGGQGADPRGPGHLGAQVHVGLCVEHHPSQLNRVAEPVTHEQNRPVHRRQAFVARKPQAKALGPSLNAENPIVLQARPLVVRVIVIAVDVCADVDERADAIRLSFVKRAEESRHLVIVGKVAAEGRDVVSIAMISGSETQRVFRPPHCQLQAGPPSDLGLETNEQVDHLRFTIAHRHEHGGDPLS
mmetsp:Transcript_69840/g.214189  ORF Transcript_69840/g.214189 Transcript_69840/m.214189 type:complete len:211 (-) Transcript_69840:1706-2338(-)